MSCKDMNSIQMQQFSLPKMICSASDVSIRALLFLKSHAVRGKGIRGSTWLSFQRIFTLEKFFWKKVNKF